MADLVSTLTQRSVEAATTKEAPERVALSGNRAHQMFVFVFSLVILFGFIASYRYVGNPSGCSVSLPVSRREPRRRCGGRRGGLNDSQHCAVGPGLQSPQRWSFPPPPSHSPSPSTQHAAASLSPSNHFATPGHPHFSRRSQLFLLV